MCGVTTAVVGLRLEAWSSKTPIRVDDRHVDVDPVRSHRRRVTPMDDCHVCLDCHERHVAGLTEVTTTQAHPSQGWFPRSRVCYPSRPDTALPAPLPPVTSSSAEQFKLDFLFTTPGKAWRTRPAILRVSVKGRRRHPMRVAPNSNLALSAQGAVLAILASLFLFYGQVTARNPVDSCVHSFIHSFTRVCPSLACLVSCPVPFCPLPRRSGRHSLIRTVLTVSACLSYV